MRKIFLAAGILGLTGVVLGAFGAHALKDLLLQHNGNQIWETAVHYQFFHALALLGLINLAQRSGINSQVRPWLQRVGWCWILGVILFSGSLYGLALGGPRLLGPITPFGGLLLIAGWCGLLVVAAKFTFVENKI